MSTNEGGTIEGEYAALAASDRTVTMAAGWLGITAGCADCHDHKFDPITQRDFYALTAYFRNTSQPVFDGNLPNTPPTVIDPVSGVETLVTDELRGVIPQAFVLDRAQYDHPLDPVFASVPAAFGVLPAGAPQNRLGLAEWLMSPTHPLAARVNVNRFWAQLFGAGIVTTVADFGVMGAPPSNPALLDWLAVEFRDSGWDVAHMYRLMLTSSTYRQSSRCSDAAVQADPYNALCACGPRFRMDAEMLRDLALAASGLLVDKVGGAPVKPYQPPGVWEAVAIDESDTGVYVQDHGDALYRRSLYTFWKRGAPPPSMDVFDAPNRTTTVPQRERTDTPLQALTSLDDVQRVEAARVLGALAVKSAANDRDRFDFIGLRVLARKFEDGEAASLAATLAKLRAYYQASPGLAADLLTVGESPADASLSPEEQASWALIASIVLNLDEAVRK
jgi:hypothetical protein